MFCDKCGRSNSYEAKFCIVCGQPLKIKKPSSPKRLLTIIGTSVLLMGGGTYGYLHHMNGNQKELVTANESNEASASESESLMEKENNETETITKTELIKETQNKVFTIITEAGQGSGFLYSREGMVVTNAHVVAGHVDVIVRDSEGKEYPGEVIGISDVEDVALIKVSALKGEEPLAIESETTEVGTEVIALGSPNGFENTASIGYLTGVDRDISYDFEYENVYQVDVQIAPGSSGGPLVEAESGKAIGINSLLYNNGNAIGFSIPLYSVKDTLDGWAENPMSAYDIAAMFEGYGDFDYSSDGNNYEEEYDLGEGSQYTMGDFEINQFIRDYRYYYEMALAEGDFYYVEDMLLYDSEIYYGIRDFINEVANQHIIYDFTGFEILDTEVFLEYAYVHTYETFDFMDTDGEWSYEERYRTYTVVADFNGYYIAEMKNN